jgi:hypothetical protein
LQSLREEEGERCRPLYFAELVVVHRHEFGILTDPLKRIKAVDKF